MTNEQLPKPGYRKIEDHEAALLAEMRQRVERATSELHTALHAFADVAVTKPQQNDPHQWRWHLSDLVNLAKRTVHHERWH